MAPRVVNPYYIYVLSFGGVMVAYQLGWSTMYPPLSGELVSFFIVTFIIASFLGWSVGPMLRRVVRSNQSDTKLSSLWLVPLVLSYVAELAYAGGIPFLAVLRGDLFAYGEFGIPSLHVYTMTFGAAYSVIEFRGAVVQPAGRGRWQAFACAAVPLAYDVAIVSRGFIVVTLAAWLLTYLLTRHVNVRRLAGVALSIGAVLAVFAILGDLRTASNQEQEFVENVILDVGEASNEFRDSIIPAGLFWGYIYATSPLSNFQYTVDHAPARTGPENSIAFVIAELMPDFVSRRLLDAIGLEKLAPELVKTALNVGSVYAVSFVYLGWAGPIIMFAAVAGLTWLYIELMPLNRFPVASLALLNIFIAFCIFDNMIYYSGMSLQLAWPLLLSMRTRRQKLIPNRHRSLADPGREVRA